MSDENNPDQAIAEEFQQAEQLNQAPNSGVEAAGFEQLQDEGGEVNLSPELDVILDIPVTVSMEVGNTDITIRNLLQLNKGSVIELDRMAGEPLDVLVNGTLIAHGEVVVLNE